LPGKSFLSSYENRSLLLLLSHGYYFSRLAGFSKEVGEILKPYVVRNLREFLAYLALLEAAFPHEAVFEA